MASLVCLKSQWENTLPIGLTWAKMATMWEELEALETSSKGCGSALQEIR